MIRMASAGGFQRVRNPHDLPTYQKRLRHLRSIAVRNLVCHTYHGIEITKMQTFFTLHRDTTSKAFYTSEKTTGSVNPTWKSFDISRYEKDINLKFKCVVLRVWVCLEERHHLLIDLTVHFSGLAYFADKLQQGGMKYNPNTVIFGMFDKYFISKDETKTSPEYQTQISEVQGSQPSTDAPSIVMKVDQSTIRGSYTSNSVSRIQTILRATKQTQATVNKVHTAIEDRLLSSQETAHKLSEREHLLMKVSQLRSELMWQTTRLQMDKDKFDKVKGDNSQRVGSFREQESNLAKSRNHHEEKKKSYVQTRESLVKENAQLLIRRKQLVGEMATYIYPITENKKKQLCLCGVWLPNAEDYQGHDETMIAVALGYTCHLTMMISQFLDLPLRYQLEHRGSRTQIRDHIHTKLSDKDRDFPLYSKGKEKFQFNYGVFLLNKNISQIRFTWGLGTNDLRLTLQNLRTLLEMRLGVKPDGLSTRSLTPTSGTGNSIASSTARDSTRSLAGSSSASSLARKEDIITSQQFDSANSINSDYRGMSADTSILDSEDKENRDNNDKKGPDFDERDTLFEGNNDDFFKVSSPASNSAITDTLLGGLEKEGAPEEALIDQDEKVNDMEALKASLHIHFDNSDGTSSPSVSYDEGENSSGEEKLQNKGGNPNLPTGKGDLISETSKDAGDQDISVSTFKTTAFRTIVEKERESSPETGLSDEYLTTAKVVS